MAKVTPDKLVCSFYSIICKGNLYDIKTLLHQQFLGMIVDGESSDGRVFSRGELPVWLLSWRHALPDLERDVFFIAVDELDDHVNVDVVYNLTGTFGRQLELPFGRFITPTGKVLRFEVEDSLVIRDGKIHIFKTTLGSDKMFRELGLRMARLTP